MQIAIRSSGARSGRANIGEETIDVTPQGCGLLAQLLG
jgi:hypothetical protein